MTHAIKTLKLQTEDSEEDMTETGGVLFAFKMTKLVSFVFVFLLKTVN